MAIISPGNNALRFLLESGVATKVQLRSHTVCLAGHPVQVAQVRYDLADVPVVVVIRKHQEQTAALPLNTDCYVVLLDTTDISPFGRDASYVEALHMIAPNHFNETGEQEHFRRVA